MVSDTGIRLVDDTAQERLATLARGSEQKSVVDGDSLAFLTDWLVEGGAQVRWRGYLGLDD